MNILHQFCDPAIAEWFAQRLLLEEHRPRLGRTLTTDRELVHWDRADRPDLWDRCIDVLGTGMIQATYVIRYRLGVELEPHQDAGSMRLILLAKAPEAGGVLSVDGQAVDLEVGDAAVFSDKRTHAVSKIEAGERWTITMGVFDQGIEKMGSGTTVRDVLRQRAARRGRRG